MENLSRRKMITIATTIAIVTIAAVIITKFIGASVVAAFFAGVGTALTIGFLILASLFIKPTDGKK